MQNGLTREAKLAQLKYWNTFAVDTCLTRDDAAAFVRYQEKLLADPSVSANNNYDVKLGDGLEKLPSYADEPLLLAIEQKLDQLIKTFADKGAFVKMSDRSPKDSTTERGRIHQRLDLSSASAFPTLAEKRNYLFTNATGLPCVYKGMMGAMKVTSGKEALRLLLMSFRTLEDVQLRLDYQSDLWDLDIVVREWVDFDISWEVRGFVCNNQFTALSQYYYDCYFENLHEHKDLLQRSVLQYWEKHVKANAPYPSYVIDFTVLPFDGIPEILPVAVIELNPFDAYTDGALFNWTLHKSLLHGGPFTFKLQDERKREKEKSWWRKILDTHLALEADKK